VVIRKPSSGLAFAPWGKIIENNARDQILETAMREILDRLTTHSATEHGVVYCAVVDTRGSTPQKAGAAMLVLPDGSQVGTLGGGCVEAEVKRQALQTLAEGAGAAQVLTFSLDDNYGWDDGLICGGKMQILADPLMSAHDMTAATYYRTLRELVASGAGCTEAVVLTEEVGVPVASRYVFDASRALCAARGPTPPPRALVNGLVPLTTRPKPWKAGGVAYLPTLPRITLLIVGGGHVGQALARLGADLDFDAWVLDDRASYASSERFPRAQRHLVGDIGQTLTTLGKELTPNVYALIVTRGHAHDEEALYHLACTAAGYVGLIGSKRKIKLIYEDLLARGVPREALARVHAPLGFNIGSQTVPEIAVSILAELIAVRNLGSSIPAARTTIAV
jgi:xanthine dehydrogenase accessory factor